MSSSRPNGLIVYFFHHLYAHSYSLEFPQPAGPPSKTQRSTFTGGSSSTATGLRVLQYPGRLLPIFSLLQRVSAGGDSAAGVGGSEPSAWCLPPTTSTSCHISSYCIIYASFSGGVTWATCLWQRALKLTSCCVHDSAYFKLAVARDLSWIPRSLSMDPMLLRRCAFLRTARPALGRRTGRIRFRCEKKGPAPFRPPGGEPGGASWTTVWLCGTGRGELGSSNLETQSQPDTNGFRNSSHFLMCPRSPAGILGSKRPLWLRPGFQCVG